MFGYVMSAFRRVSKGERWLIDQIVNWFYIFQIENVHLTTSETRVKEFNSDISMKNLSDADADLEVSRQ